jgi:predicted nucleotidyltransferase
VLFGSRARGQARPDSDYDLALKPGHPPAPLDRVAWQVEIENLLGADVSLVLLTPATDPVLGWEIARDGKLLYERHRGLWMAERARLWHLYNDALPFRRALAESLRPMLKSAPWRVTCFTQTGVPAAIVRVCPFAQMSRDEIEKQHYTVERILELLVGAAAD